MSTTSQFSGMRHMHGGGFAFGGSLAEGICGVAAIVLAIIGLAHADWTMLAAVATIVAGAALAFEGAAATARSVKMTAGQFTESESGSLSVEFLGGITGVVLGVLAILGLEAGILVSAAVIVFGASLMLESVGTSRFSSMTTGPEMAGEGSRTMFFSGATSGWQVLIGLAAIVLGIIALVSSATAAATLNLVALLVIGGGILLTGTAISSRMLNMFNK